MHTGHTTTSTRTRLLWTLGLATVGIGLTLALDSRPAHADDTTRPETPILNSVEQLVDDTLRNVAELPAAVAEPTTTGRPRPVRNLVTHTTKTVDTAVADVTGTVRAVTDTADKTTRPLPVLGETVDQVTDLTDHITTRLPPLTPPTKVDTAPTPNRPAQPAAGDGSDDTSPSGTPTPAPVVGGGEGGQDEDASGAAPVPHGQAAAPDAHHPAISSSSRAGATGSTTSSRTRPAATASRNTPDMPTPLGEPTHCANTTGSLNTTANGEPQPSTPVYWAHHPPTHRRHTTDHAHDATHRTAEPPAPSG